MQLTDDAIEVLREYGWIKGSIWSPDGYCVMGALQTASRKNWLRSDQTYRADSAAATQKLTDAVRTLQLVLREQGFSWSSVTEWNDKHARDVDEVIGMLKLTGERMDQQT